MQRATGGGCGLPVDGGPEGGSVPPNFFFLPTRCHFRDARVCENAAVQQARLGRGWKCRSGREAFCSRPPPSCTRVDNPSGTCSGGRARERGGGVGNASSAPPVRRAAPRVWSSGRLAGRRVRSASANPHVDDGRDHRRRDHCRCDRCRRDHRADRGPCCRNVGCARCVSRARRRLGPRPASHRQAAVWARRGAEGGDGGPGGLRVWRHARSPGGGRGSVGGGQDVRRSAGR